MQWNTSEISHNVKNKQSLEIPCRLNLLDTSEKNCNKNLPGSIATTDNNGIFFPFTCAYVVFITALKYWCSF